MIPENVLKAHRIAAFLAATSPEGTPFFNDFLEVFSHTDFYKSMTPAETMEAQADMKLRMEFVNDLKVSQNFVMAEILQEMLLNLQSLNNRGKNDAT